MKLWTPLSTILRRTLPSIPYFPTSQFQSPTYYFSPSPPSSSTNSPNSLTDNFHFPLKTFCSGSPENFHVRCWTCGHVAKAALFLVCHSCRTIQPVDQSVDYFHIFGLKFDIGVENLEGKYKEWQKKLHPDLVHSKSEEERGYAAEQCGRVIDAYRTLSKPLVRAIYVLRLEGLHVDEEETLSDPELLSEILEIREAVEEAADSQELNQIQSQEESFHDCHPGSSSNQKYAYLFVRMREKLSHWSNSFANAYRCRNFEEAQNSIRRMTYYERVNEEIVKKL